MAGCGHHQRDAPSLTQRQHVHCPFGRRKVEEHIENLAVGHVAAQSNTEATEAAYLADVAAQQRVARRFQCDAERQFLVLLAQVREALAHAAGRAVDADDDLHEYTSIARMISSRLFGTCTARLA